MHIPDSTRFVKKFIMHQCMVYDLAEKAQRLVNRPFQHLLNRPFPHSLSQILWFNVVQQ